MEVGAAPALLHPWSGSASRKNEQGVARPLRVAASLVRGLPDSKTVTYDLFHVCAWSLKNVPTLKVKRKLFESRETDAAQLRCNRARRLAERSASAAFEPREPLFPLIEA